MNRKILVVFVALMAVAMLATPAIALGPANNPKAIVDPISGDVMLKTPSANGHEFIQDGRINHYLSAKSNGEGIMNNVNLIVDSAADLMYLGQHASEFMSMTGWVYLSGEETAGGTWGGHGAFYWFLIIFQVPPNQASAIAADSPYGIYLGGHDLGWK